MPKAFSNNALTEILNTLEDAAKGLSIGDILKRLGPAPSPRTLQYRLRHLVKEGAVEAVGQGPARKYRLPTEAPARETGSAPIAPATMAISKAGAGVLDYIRRPEADRRPVGYDPDFLDTYRPNETYYLTQVEQARLHEIGRQAMAAPAGTYARHILDRLLIDLAWNSSRLEGNTYSLADTQRLIQQGIEAAGRPTQEAQMILNHKAAIEFLVNNAGETGFDAHTIKNLHGLLADNLLTDTLAPGRLRFMEVKISGSVFEPLANPDQIGACFETLLQKARAINNPFEQAFFVMVHLPYLQPFDDVNKRVSRLAANIPFIKGNLSPLSFSEVPETFYTFGTLGVYELNDISLLKDVFLWAYERSAARYKAVRQSLGEPDPLRLTYRSELREIVSRIVRGRVSRGMAETMVREYAARTIVDKDRKAFSDMVLIELDSLHDGNYARYSVRPSEFADWLVLWKGGSLR